LLADYQDGQQLQEWKKRLHHDKELCNAKRNIQQLQKVFMYVLVDLTLRCLTASFLGVCQYVNSLCIVQRSFVDAFVLLPLVRY
jgi:hypothetical protein